MPKFAHIADTHIKNLKYHYEYRIVFEQLYEKIKDLPFKDPSSDLEKKLEEFIRDYNLGSNASA